MAAAAFVCDTVKNPFAVEMFCRLAMDDVSAALATFVELLRQAPVLREWLWEEFVHDERARAGLARYLEDGVAPTTEGHKLLAWFSGEHAYAKIQAELKKLFAERLTGSCYGGLTRVEVVSAIRRYQAGTFDFGAFILAQAWQRRGVTLGSCSPRLLRASQGFILEALNRSDNRLLNQLANAREYFADKTGGHLSRSDYGYSDWWKVSLLLYMLNHPKPRYRTREFRVHLAAQRLRVDSHDIRRFCKRHGIARDSRAGRPRKI